MECQVLFSKETIRIESQVLFSVETIRMECQVLCFKEMNRMEDQSPFLLKKRRKHILLPCKFVICVLSVLLFFCIYSRLSLSRIPRDPLKYFEIFVPRHIKNCRIEEKINRTTTFNKCICNFAHEVRDILKILWKRGEIAPEEQFLLFSTIFFTCC